MAARNPKLDNSPRKRKTARLSRLKEKCRDLPNGRNLTPQEVTQLRDAARDYSTLLFNVGQLAVIMSITEGVISHVARHAETPFVAGGKARPEWVLAFLQKPPKGFDGR